LQCLTGEKQDSGCLRKLVLVLLALRLAAVLALLLASLQVPAVLVSVVRVAVHHLAHQVVVAVSAVHRVLRSVALPVVLHLAVVALAVL